MQTHTHTHTNDKSKQLLFTRNQGRVHSSIKNELASVSKTRQELSRVCQRATEALGRGGEQVELKLYLSATTTQRKTTYAKQWQWQWQGQFNCNFNDCVRRIAQVQCSDQAGSDTAKPLCRYGNHRRCEEIRMRVLSRYFSCNLHWRLNVRPPLNPLI